jgi:alkylation response protein AidB-like acyl-CoA dehydrogenase
MVEGLLAAVERMRPLLERCGAQAEAERALPHEAYDAMLDSGLFRMLAPRAFGGLELHPVEALRVIEAVSRVDSAAGWCLNISQSVGSFACWLPKEGGEELFERGSTTLFAGGFFPPAPAVPVPGGWRVTARTAFNSGCHRAQWFAVPIVEVDDESSKFDPHTEDPPPLVTFVPREEVSILDTWHTSGMRGTFSADVHVDDAFVPSRRIAHIKRWIERAPAFAGPLYGTCPWLSAHGEAAVSLGVAGAAIDKLIDLALRKTPSYARAPLHAREMAQHHAGRASALLDSSRVFLHDTITRAYEDAESNGWYSDESRLRCQLAACFAAESCAGAVDLVCEAAGTSAGRIEHGFERHHRDVHFLAKHALKSYSRYEDVGKILFGSLPAYFLLRL